MTLKQKLFALTIMVSACVATAQYVDAVKDPPGMPSETDPVSAVAPTIGLQPDFVDSLLFTIELNLDSTSLFFADWTDNLNSSLAGPVMMSGGRFLFHSRHGYVVYDVKGKLLEEHSMIKENAAAVKAGKPQIRLAYPFDGESVIYYADTEPVEVYRKRLGKKGLDKVSAAEMEMFKDIKRHEPLNIYRSGTTEDVGRKTPLMPHLAGFTSLTGGSKWWSVGMFFSFTSPMIMETNNQFVSFFPGLKEDEGGEDRCNIPIKMIEPLGVSSRDGRWYYLGVQANTGTKEDEYYQTIILCDQAGNILYCSQMLKQEISNAVLDRRRDQDGIMTEFTVRRPGRHVFLPSVDPYGDIFYGVIAWEWRKLEVYKRSFVRFLPRPTAPAFADKFAEEEAYSFIPVKTDCSGASRKGILPEVILKDKVGGMQLLEEYQLVRDSLYVKVHRLPDEEIKRRLSRAARTMPPHIAAIQDSISKLPTAWCPYGISLNHTAKGTLFNLDYGFGDIVVSTRILGRSKDKNIYVRVDLEDWAEVVVFTPDGKFLERFTFNNTHYKDRNDVLVLDPSGVVYERDYEADASKKKKKGPAGFRFQKWERSVRPIWEVSGASAAEGKGKKK